MELLKRSDDIPNPGDEALRLAVLARPVSEVAVLFDLLRADPNAVESSRDALRAAAVDRSVEEVAQLIALFDRPQEGGGHGFGPADPFDMSDHFPPGPPGPGNPGGGPPEPEPTAAMHVLDPDVRPLGNTAGHPGPAGHPEAAHREAAMPQPPGRPPWAGRPAGPQHGRGAPPWPGAHEEPRQPGYAVPGVLRSVLRWPAAGALALCGVSHLPVNTSPAHGAQAAVALSMAIAVVYLLLSGWLAMRDTALVWTVSAAAAMVIVAVHALSRAGVLTPLGSGLGDTGMWPEMVAVALAIVTAGLAGAALLSRTRRVGPAPAGL
ncbi:hypothetical protein SSP35_17_01000 [Streptomyces sp. NBRC 110611]|uniref:hypothetical protein n=1 Tax=Streptomyces sp. NBRC 110611 TaxID=1621259 RepID=UPI0008566A9E|nr:hypothetical protein [Streptomyces sp. NBRC 110611]GAU70245.1 hypothetical protein SSP35_17_01000 [Streptomyces sp. NBRC 110611]